MVYFTQGFSFLISQFFGLFGRFIQVFGNSNRLFKGVNNFAKKLFKV